MNLEELEASRAEPEPPANLPPLLEALWWDAREDWERAHAIAQDIETLDGAWVHAYLHRREGDPGNAAYWYRQAGRPVCRGTLPEEWREIAAALLAGRGTATAAQDKFRGGLCVRSGRACVGGGARRGS